MRPKALAHPSQGELNPLCTRDSEPWILHHSGPPPPPKTQDHIKVNTPVLGSVIERKERRHSIVGIVNQVYTINVLFAVCRRYRNY